jgi:hypothetical protein
LIVFHRVLNWFDGRSSEDTFLPVFAACFILGCIAGALVAAQRSLSPLTLFLELCGAAALMNALYMLDSSGPIVVPVSVALLAEALHLLWLFRYKLRGATYRVSPDAWEAGYWAEPYQSSFFCRRWQLHTPDRQYDVEYRAIGIHEWIAIDGQRRYWPVYLTYPVRPRFDFAIGRYQATLTIRSTFWLTVRQMKLIVDDFVVYAEGGL